LASTATARELIRVLTYPKFALSADEQEQLLGDYMPWVEVISVPDHRPRPRHAAIGWTCRSSSTSPPPARQHALVSGDRDLLALAGSPPTPVQAFARPDMPVLYLLGGASPESAHAVAERLESVLPRVR
jgi:hypothetical protein